MERAEKAWKFWAYWLADHQVELYACGCAVSVIGKQFRSGTTQEISANSVDVNE